MFYDVVLTVDTCAESGEGSLAWALAQAAEYDSAQIKISAALAGQTLVLRSADEILYPGDKKTVELWAVSLEVPSGVTLQVDGCLALCEDAQLVLYPGSELCGTEPYSDIVVYEGGAIYADSCAIGVTLNYYGSDAEEDAWQLNQVQLTAVCPFGISLDATLPAHWDYTCTHPDAYAMCMDFVVAAGDSFTLTRKFMEAHTPEGCKYLHFVQPLVEGELVLEAGLTLHVNDLTVFEESVLRCGKGVTLCSSPWGTGGVASDYVLALYGGTLVAEDLTLEGTLYLGSEATVQGSGIRFAAPYAVCVGLDNWDGCSPIDFLPADSYVVTHPDAVFGLDIYGAAGYTLLTADGLQELLPAGFASAAINNIYLEDCEPGAGGSPISYTVQGIPFVDNALIDTDATVYLELVDTALGKNTYVSILDGYMENVDFSGAPYMNFGSMSLTGCYGAATICLESQASFSASDCDFSAIHWAVEDWYPEPGTTINLSGNYWGTTDMAEILSRFGEYAEYVRIDSVLSEWSATYDICITSTAAEGEGSLFWAMEQAAEYSGSKPVRIHVADSLAGSTLWLNDWVEVPSFATLELPAGVNISSVQSPALLEPWERFDSAGLLLNAGAVLQLAGDTTLDTFLRLTPTGRVSGGALSFAPGAEIHLVDWEGSTAALDDILGQSMTADGMPTIFLYSAMGDVTLEPLANGTSSYYIADLWDTTLTVTAGTTLVASPYLDLWEDSHLIMQPGSYLTGEAVDCMINLGDVDCSFTATDCTIGIAITVPEAAEEMSRVVLDNVTLTAQCPFRLFGPVPEEWTYTCTHPNPYAEYLNVWVDAGEQYTITQQFMEEITPTGCKFTHLVWPMVEGELVLEEGLTVSVEDITVSEGAVLRCGKGVTLRPDPTYAIGKGSPYVVMLNNGTLVAENLTLEGTLFLGADSTVQATGIRFVAQYAVCVEVMDWDAASPINFLPTDSYAVTRKDAIFGLDIYGATASTVLTPESLQQFIPAGFATGAINYISLYACEPGADGEPLRYVLDGVTILDDSGIDSDESVFLEIRNTALGDDTGICIKNGRMENVDLTGSYFTGMGNLEMSACYGAATIILDGVSYLSARGCDFSAIRWNTDGYTPVEEGAMLDLSGNYWGTTDVAEILSRFGDYAEYVRIDSVLSEWSAPEDPSADSLLELAPSPTAAPGIYAMAAESRVAVGAQRLYKLSTEEAGAWDISVAAGSYASPLMLSVGTLAEDGAFQAAESLYLVPDAATTSLRGVCTPAGQELYICVQATQGTSDFSLNISGTQAATAGLVTQDNSPAAATALAADGSTTHGWVGYGDAADFYRVQMDSAGSLSIALAELDSAARLRIYEQRADGSLAQLESLAARPGDSLDRTLQLTAGSYFIELAALDHGAGLHNSAYALTLQKEESSPLTSLISIA